MYDEKLFESISLEKSDSVKKLLDVRYILDDEIKMVILNAETTEKKLYQPDNNRFLAKMRIGNVTFYVEYSHVSEKIYIIHTAYSHRAELRE